MDKLILKILCGMLFLKLNKPNTSINSVGMRQLPYTIQVIAENLYVPWAIAISDEGNLYFTERSGAIRVIKNNVLLPDPLITLRAPFTSQGEGGLMGLVLDPNYSQNHYMYVMHSYTEGGQIYNRVLRLIENNDRASIDRILLDQIPGNRIHNGGRLKIGPDNLLYITTGDAAEPSLAQDYASLSGKILRLTLDGNIPADNPIPNSPIYSLGLRNPQGLSWNAQGVLYASEHGPSANDEINIIFPGANYGWPLAQTNESTSSALFQPPLISSGVETWAPAGIAFITQGPWQNKLLVAALRGQKLLSITLNADGTAVENIEFLLLNDYGRLREVIEGPDGSIYLTTSNQDGRGSAAPNDDRILRLIPNTP